MSMYVVGHKIPDSDSICGAIALHKIGIFADRAKLRSFLDFFSMFYIIIHSFDASEAQIVPSCQSVSFKEVISCLSQN